MASSQGPVPPYPYGTSRLPRVDIVRDGHTIRHVYVDGFEVRALREVHTEHTVGQPPTVTLVIVADDVVMRDVKAGGTALAGSSNGVTQTESYVVRQGDRLIGMQDEETT